MAPWPPRPSAWISNVGRGHHRARPDRELAERQAAARCACRRPRSPGNARTGLPRSSRRPPPCILLGGLEDEVAPCRRSCGSRRVAARRRAASRCGRRGRRRAYARRLRGVRQAGRLVDRQGVHVGAQADARPPAPRPQHADDAGPGEPARGPRRARTRAAARRPRPRSAISSKPSSGWACRSRRQAVISS